MSIPTILATGFLFLGGIGPLLMLIGAFPLILHLAQVWLSWHQTPSPPTFDQLAKEDSHETQN